MAQPVYIVTNGDWESRKVFTDRHQALLYVDRLETLGQPVTIESIWTTETAPTAAQIKAGEHRS